MGFVLTGGQTFEYTQAESPITGLNVDYVMADMGYDSNQFVSTIIAQQATPVIPFKEKPEGT